MISRSLWRSRPCLGLLRPHDARRHDDPQRGDVPSVGFGVEGPQDGLGERVADDRGRVDPVDLHVVEELLGAEVATLHGRDRAADHQVADRVEEARAVHQRRGRHVARAGLADAFGDRVEILLGWACACGCWRRARRRGRPGATSPPWASRWCRRCRAAGGGRPSGPTGPARCRRCRPGAAASYGVAQSGHGPDPSSTQSHVRTLGTRARTASTLVDERAVEHHGGRVGVVPQVDEFVGGVAVVGVDDREADLERGEDRLEVLRAVVEVLRHLVLLGRLGPQQRRRDAVRPAG